MANTYTQLYIQYVFAVKGRENLLQKNWRADVFKYISGIIETKGHKSIIVNGVADHVHVFVGLSPTMSISDLIRDIKNNSSKFINENRFIKGKFEWQAGYGAFSYSRSQIKRVYDYILNQENHHKNRTFKEEYLEMLRKYEIDFDEQYLFTWIEEEDY
jgi:REP element-mobilizing transposase RayT